MNRSIVSVLAAALGLAAAPAFAQSAAFPSRPVRIMVGFAPGGSVDLVARALSQRLSVIWGRQVVVENRPGAASHIAGLAVSRAEPDGHTLLVTSMGALGTNLALYRTMPYNPLKDLSPLALLVSQNLVLIVNPALPVKTVRDYISLAKARPGEVTYGSAGSGGPLHLSAEMFAHRVGVRLSHITYKGGALAAVDVMGGQIASAFQPEPEALPHIRSGRVRAIAVTGPNRSQQLPDGPTIAESGVPGYAFVSWTAAAAPPGMSRELQERISADFNAALKSPDVRQRLNEVGLEITGGTPEQMATFARAEVNRIAELVKVAGIPLLD
jgi:tripartite-type tricarboxylate transporter receptor subunit TctC